MKRLLFVLGVFGLIATFQSCKEESLEKVKPTIRFAVESGFISVDTVLSFSQTVKI